MSGGSGDDDEVSVEIRGGDAALGAGGRPADGAVAGLDGGDPDARPPGGADADAAPAAADGRDGAGESKEEKEAPPADAAPGAGGEDGAEAADLRSRLRDAEAKVAGLEDQLRRALADYRNLERRSREGIDAAVRDRVARFAADMVSVRDDFERAARVAGGGGNAGPGGAGEGAVSAGLGTVLRGMDSALSKHGVEPIEAIGEIFDPRRHEAVATAEDAALDEGTITAEVARGYSLDERIIRPSRVVASKKPGTEEAGV